VELCSNVELCRVVHVWDMRIGHGTSIFYVQFRIVVGQCIVSCLVLACPCPRNIDFLNAMQCNMLT